ncbi:phosphoglucosamine mutase [Lacihabitans sp. CS3-21]|uniref:phosphoglucosamine mutase n=1 Tax=Lacihabitans sp. CS3-21 TaxID=2487332 RepID=UPI000BDDDAF0|nr:phosphoglucosamine mutase [Lacihabitans sp. CS3-21]MCP9748522.1 phosphoglucosamine mutase [Lacihabitans sp. CS3-21]MDP1813028.1 phosphoglucosamine mutase [Leadbetterella sp.]OYU66427.1 MAG: phosphoglucosamine mutase [Cytophagaceae bacterium BCCC1]
MTLIKSISGIRGTIGGKSGESLTPLDVVKFTAAFAATIISKPDVNKKVVIGRDARPSGKMVSDLVVSTLIGMGLDVIDLGLSTTPTVEIAVPLEAAGGGIILTASHNPIQWNALKLLNEKGEFISGSDGEKLLEIAEKEDFSFAEVKQLGKYHSDDTYLQKHIDAILNLSSVNVEAIKSANFKIVVDAVNSSGGFAVPMLLKALGVTEIKELNCEPTGIFAHNPEPLPENLREISGEMKKGDYDLGIVVDPDVDRLALICEDGEPFGEEYTLVAVADYILSINKKQKNTTVSNLSSTMALKDVTEKHGGEYFSAAVGEVNVVEKMKESGSIIGGEGNGGIIFPELHYGRDALVGIALFLTHLAKFNKPVGFLRKKYPNYFIAKKKIELDQGTDVDLILEKIQKKYIKYNLDTRDGVKIHFDKEWVHLRKSNTEPIIRIYAESEFETKADNLADKIIQDIKELMTA